MSEVAVNTRSLSLSVTSCGVVNSTRDYTQSQSQSTELTTNTHTNRSDQIIIQCVPKMRLA